MANVTMEGVVLQRRAAKRSGLRRFMQRKSMIAFLMTLPLIPMEALARA